jgi:hypothetical protein
MKPGILTLVAVGAFQFLALFGMRVESQNLPTDVHGENITLKSGRLWILPLELDSAPFEFQSADGKKETCRVFSTEDLHCSKEGESYVPTMVGAIGVQSGKRYLIACVDGDTSCLRPKYGVATVEVEGRTVRSLEWNIVITDRKTGRRIDDAPAFFTILARVETRSTVSEDAQKPVSGVEAVSADITGTYEGKVENATARISALFELDVREERGNSLSGCMAVHRPLYGSGELHGAVGQSQITFDVSSSIGTIKFAGGLEGETFTGTYLVFRKDGGTEEGKFELHRQNKTLPASFDPKNCPGDFNDSLKSK